MLSVVDVSASYGPRAALTDVSFEAVQGVCAVVGRNGAGKTTLMSVIAGLLSPDSGTVHVGGVEVSGDAAAAAPLVGCAPQQLAVYPTLTARENLLVFAELAGLRGAAAQRRINDALDMLGVGDLSDRRVATLSGGQQRCVHTAIAVLHRPGVLLLDEPTVGVDVEHRSLLLAAVRSLADDGAVVLYSTHYLAEIPLLDPVAVLALDQGMVRFHGSPSRLVDAPRRLRVVFDDPDLVPTLPSVRDGDGWLVEVDDIAEALTLLSASPDSRSVRSVNVVDSGGIDGSFAALLGDSKEVA